MSMHLPGFWGNVIFSAHIKDSSNFFCTFFSYTSIYSKNISSVRLAVKGMFVNEHLITPRAVLV